MDRQPLVLSRGLIFHWNLPAYDKKPVSPRVRLFFVVFQEKNKASFLVVVFRHRLDRPEDVSHPMDSRWPHDTGTPYGRVLELAILVGVRSGSATCERLERVFFFFSSWFSRGWFSCFFFSFSAFFQARKKTNILPVGVYS